MNELGRFAILLALVASGWSAIAAFVGARNGHEAAVRSGEGGLKAAALCLSVAALALFYALVNRDFSLEYVASYTSRGLSMFYTLGAFWAGQAGSLLLWAWVLSLYGAIVLRQNRTKNRNLMPYVVAVMATVLFVFTFLVAFQSNPFATLAAAPPDGQGLNPLLQNYGQWIHPITMYMGYVGFTVPFAFAIAALATGNLGDRWIRTVRKWSLWAWLLLGVGILFGARWAYVELGWGGYWGWDPVENASLMPWLVGTAYLHSVMIQEKRGMLKVWNVFLILATFALSVFGTFLTRSGIIGSVHAFSQSNIGPYLIGFVMLIVIGAGSLIVWRLPELRGAGSIDSVVSREASFLLNNLLLVAMAFAVFWGTVFPLVAEAVRGVKVSVGPPFFQAILTPMGVALLALAGFCPLLAWRKASTKNLRRNFTIPVVGGLGAFAVLAVLTRLQHLGDDLVLALGAFVTVTIVQEFARGMRARGAIRGERWYKALPALFGKNPRRYGGYLIHFGVVVLLMGVALNVAYKKELRVPNMAVGQSAHIESYDVTLDRVRTEETAVRYSVIGDFGVKQSDGRNLGTVVAMRSQFLNQEQPATEVGIRSTLFADLYIIMQSADPRKGIVSLAVIVNPGVFWIWVGALILVAGGVIVGWPGKGTPDRPRATRKEVRGDAPLEPLEPVGASV